MKFAFNTTPKMIATAVAVLGAVLALAAYKVGASPSGAALPVFVGVCAFLVLLFCATQINLAFQVPSQPAPPEPRERSHRQELELAMAHGMGPLVANPSYAGKRVGSNIREALDAMEVQAAVSAVSCKGPIAARQTAATRANASLKQVRRKAGFLWTPTMQAAARRV
ncbi:hypothetical protein JQN63_11590 [Delftia lacustris]|uniref:hypothetical protein n=1 Tax=Delftia lacustris TaxID=558537 RepID=UPI00193B144A|nr:hypothetical protein [Delftia lacustris]QRI92473.1 hypothetical protein JQN63_11125 [Delftia lacustris]QRI92546.1 hypothetical protein JQN63_11590 [Delftia lacustris]